MRRLCTLQLDLRVLKIVLGAVEAAFDLVQSLALCVQEYEELLK